MLLYMLLRDFAAKFAEEILTHVRRALLEQRKEISMHCLARLFHAVSLMVMHIIAKCDS